METQTETETGGNSLGPKNANRHQRLEAATRGISTRASGGSDRPGFGFWPAEEKKIPLFLVTQFVALHWGSPEKRTHCPRHTLQKHSPVCGRGKVRGWLLKCVIAKPLRQPEFLSRGKLENVWGYIHLVLYSHRNQEIRAVCISMN